MRCGAFTAIQFTLGVLLTVWFGRGDCYAQPPVSSTTPPAGTVVARDFINVHASDFDPTRPDASIDKSRLIARKFVENSNNKGPANLDADYFKTNLRVRQPIGPNQSLSIQTGGNAGPLIPALIVATAMQEVDRDEPDDAKLLTAWNQKQAQVLSDMVRGEPISLLDSRVQLAWQHFLDDWALAAVTKSNLRDGLKSAPYELLAALVEEVEGQIRAAPRGPGGGASSTISSGSGTSAAASYFPFHERLMNHIYRHNDRVIARAGRIRSRR